MPISNRDMQVSSLISLNDAKFTSAANHYEHSKTILERPRAILKLQTKYMKQQLTLFKKLEDCS